MGELKANQPDNPLLVASTVAEQLKINLRNADTKKDLVMWLYDQKITLDNYNERLAEIAAKFNGEMPQ